MEKHVVDRITHSFQLTLSGLVKGYILTARTEGKSPHTITFYESILNKFQWYAQKHGYTENPQELNQFHIAEFLSYVQNEPVRWGGTSITACQPANLTTVRHYYRTLYTFFGWLVKEGFITDNPVAHIKTPKPEKKIIQALTPSEIQLLFDVCSGKSVVDVRNKAVLSVLLDTGLRANELANLTLDDRELPKLDTGN